MGATSFSIDIIAAARSFTWFLLAIDRGIAWIFLAAFERRTADWKLSVGQCATGLVAEAQEEFLTVLAGIAIMSFLIRLQV
jgi:hypothetical protein